MDKKTTDTESVEETLLEKLSNDPDAIAELTRAELTDARAEVMEAGREQSALAKDKEATAEARKEALAAVKEATERLAAIDERIAAFEAEDAEIDTEVAELEVAFEPADELVEEETPEASEEETPEEPEDTPEVEPEAQKEEKVAVAASSQPSVGALAKRQSPKTKAPEPKGLVASAAPGVADVREFSTPDQIGAAALKVWNSFGRSSKVDEQVTIASFDTSQFNKYQVDKDEASGMEFINQLQADLRAIDSPEALVASGICAPAEPRYDYFSIAASTGLIQLPTATATRGAITFRTSPSYQTVLANATWAAAAGQVYTNTNAEAEDSKNVFSVICPETTTCTIEAYPVILQFGNFTARFDPETVANTIENSMVFHDHFVNGNLIADMVTASTAQGGGDTGGGGLVNVANLVGFEAAKYRDTFRMDMDALLELVAPSWVRDALVADYVARHATTDWSNARARVDALFASLRVSVQWVQDWQSIGDAGDDGFRPAADLLLFAPGTFVRLDGGSLDLGIVRDSTLNATNEFQTFVESFQAVCEVGHDSWLLDDVTICPRGSAGIDVALDCNPGYGS